MSEQSDELQKWKDKIQFLADEIRLQTHLASMDAKDAWSRLEPKVESFEKEVQEAGSHAAQELGKKLAAELENFKTVFSST